MSKATTAHEADEDLQSAEEVEAVSSSSQPLIDPDQTPHHEELDHFLITYGLQQHADTFHKAAVLLQTESNHQEALLSDHDLLALSREQTHKWSQPRTLYFTISICALGAIEQGWAQTGMNGANLYLPTALALDPGSRHGVLILGVINCALFLGQAVFGAWLSAPLNRPFGRRGAIFIATALCLVGNLGSAGSSSWQSLLFFRLVLGTGTGLNGSTVNVLSAESTPAYIRGGLAVMWQMFVAFGILLGFLANVAFFDVREGLVWRLQLIAPVLPTLPLLLLIYACPESAAWHAKYGRYRQAFDSLRRLRNTELQAAMELYSSYTSSLAKRRPQHDEQDSFIGSLQSLLTVPRNRHALYASYTVQFSQAICGINIIAFYSSTIFSSSGFSSRSALWASVIFGAVNFLGAIPAIWTMDTLGRRKLLLWTLIPMAVTMTFASLSFSLPQGTGRLVALAGTVYVFCALYSPGMGPVPCAYSAEVFPAEVREVGMSFAVSTISFWATVLSLTFPALLNGLGERGSFGLYAGLNVVAWVLCFVFVREVKGKALEELDEVFEEPVGRFLRSSWREISGGWQSKGGWTAVGQDELD
ncbi:hypothetical protein LTR62_006525 [Meristemomyces frigidus]|uniref:Major facilitator superfamily (MFS) profile domain-containing protein n=1 Tax=Meristemomyces frigidus TaxID=1508187 RepID=A0AAN7YEE4_9PEZI|nr:hypothetical protein LTR62_006525 [Meristemomyces frigidus]